MGITELAEIIRAGLARLERLARDADTFHPWTVEDGDYGPRVHVHEDRDEVWSRDGQGVTAAYRCDDPYDDCASAQASYLAEAVLIRDRAEPRRVLADVARDRALLDEALGWEHAEHEDEWHSCPAHPERIARWPREPRDCTCGRDARVLAVLTHLAAAYQETT